MEAIKGAVQHGLGAAFISTAAIAKELELRLLARVVRACPPCALHNTLGVRAKLDACKGGDVMSIGFACAQARAWVAGCSSWKHSRTRQSCSCGSACTLTGQGHHALGGLEHRCRVRLSASVAGLSCGDPAVTPRCARAGHPRRAPDAHAVAGDLPGAARVAELCGAKVPGGRVHRHGRAQARQRAAVPHHAVRRAALGRARLLWLPGQRPPGHRLRRRHAQLTPAHQHGQTLWVPGDFLALQSIDKILMYLHVCWLAVCRPAAHVHVAGVWRHPGFVALTMPRLTACAALSSTLWCLLVGMAWCVSQICMCLQSSGNALAWYSHCTFL